MPDYSDPLNTGAGKITAAEKGDPGDGVSSVWYFWIRSKILGEKADTGVITTDTTPASMIALLKGLLIRFGVAAGLTGGIFKAEDEAHTSGDLVVPMGVVRQDTKAALANTTGDYSVPTVDNLNQLRTVDGNIPGYPSGATPKTATSGNVAAAAATATLAAGGAGTTNYITGFSFTAAGATAAAIVLLTITNLITGTLTYVIVVPAGVGTMVEPLIIDFSTPIPANATATAIVVSCPSLGAGNTNACVNARGFHI